MPASAIKLPEQAGWINPQSLNWLKEVPHRATGQAIFNAIESKNIFPQGKSGKSTLFNSPAVSGTDGNTLRPALSFSAVRENGDETTELSVDHVQLQRDGGHQEQWSAPEQSPAPTSGERPILASHGSHSKAAESPRQPQDALTGVIQPGPPPRPPALNSLVMRL